jgi:Zn-dependent protease with chaperone function
MHQFLILVFFIALTTFSKSGEPLLVVSGRTASFVAVFGFLFLTVMAIGLGAAARWQIRRKSLISMPLWFSWFLSAFPILVLVSFLASLSLGWLLVLRSQFPGSWFLPEYATVTQPIALLVLAHGVYVWVRQQSRANKLAQSEGALGRIQARADETQPIGPTLAGQDPDRPGFSGIFDALVNYLRHNVALVAAPLLIIVAWGRLVEIYLAEPSLSELRPYESVLTLAGTIGVFILAPLIVIRIWNTHALPQGPLNESLMAICRRYGVGVRKILVWHTKGTLTNAAVMGVTSRFRFILLTDALLDRVHPRLIQAVMAHEVAHIRLRHIPWLMASAMALLMGILMGCEPVILYGIQGVLHLFEPWQELHKQASQLLHSETFTTVVVAGLGLVIWLPCFGWVSRRFERQADTFAVEHFAIEKEESPGPILIAEDDAQSMVGALDAVASLNAIPVTQKSWRHGAIRWRQNYLLSLVGKPVGTPSVHRTITFIKLVTVLTISLLIAQGIYEGLYGPPAAPTPSAGLASQGDAEIHSQSN